jgi:serine/threonine protein phosphatase PrpC
MIAAPASPLTVDTALGLCASRGSRTIDVGAGRRGDVLVVADGLGGHCTGWLGARVAVRTILGRLADAEALFVGAADGFPDDWGWAGFMQSSRAAEHVYDECVAAFGDLAALPPELPALFAAIDRVVATVPRRFNINGLMVGCIAAIVDGARVRGAHAGIGRALLLRAGAGAFADLVVEHYWHLVIDRLTLPPGVERSQIPHNVIFNGLGALETSGVGIDEFAARLGAGDVLLLCSQRLDIPDDEAARIVRTAVDERVPLADLARAHERRAAATYPEPEAHRATDVAFALALARPAA